MYDTDVPVLANIIDVNPLTLLVVLILALLILGPGKLPEVAGALGKSIREFRRTSNDLQESMSVSAPAPGVAAPAVATTDPVATPTDADVDPQAKIRMLEDRLAALEKERESAPRVTDS
jgi:TatA/E family protein of Tat protein translocase